MSNADQTPDQDAVGYRRPPKAHQFKKGQPSANPNGRRGASKPPPDENDVICRVLSRKVKLTLNGRSEEITVDEAIAAKLAQLAMQGDVQAAKELERRRRNPRSTSAKEAEAAQAPTQEEKEHHDRMLTAVFIALGLKDLGLVVEDTPGQLQIRYEVLQAAGVDWWASGRKDAGKFSSVMTPHVIGLPPKPEPARLLPWSKPKGSD